MIKLILIFTFLLFLTSCANKVEDLQTDQGPAVPSETKPELSCPGGQINDPYPGSCGFYTDKNNNSLCDSGENTL